MTRPAFEERQAYTPISKFLNRVRIIVNDIKYKNNYGLVVKLDEKSGQRIYIQVECFRPDTVTGEWGTGRGGKAYLSEHMTDQEIVQQAFGLFKGYEEHECREFFSYKGKRIFGPHISLEALMEIADRTTYRETK